MTEQDVGVLVALLAFPISLGTFVMGVYYGHRMVQNCNVDYSVFYPGERRLNVIFRPHQLNAEGKKARKALIKCQLIFAWLWGSAVIVGWLTHYFF